MLFFLIGFIPIIPEMLTLKAASIKTLFSLWSVAALAYHVLMTEIDIYVISHPPNIREMKLFSKHVKKFEQNFSWLKLIIIKIKNVFDEAISGSSHDKSRLLKRLKSLGYTGLLILAILPGFGRASNWIYAKANKSLALGRYFIYTGCLIRFLLLFGGLNYLWPGN